MVESALGFMYIYCLKLIFYVFLAFSSTYYCIRGNIYVSHSCLLTWDMRNGRLKTCCADVNIYLHEIISNYYQYELRSTLVGLLIVLKNFRTGQFLKMIFMIHN